MQIYEDRGVPVRINEGSTSTIEISAIQQP